MCAYTGTFWIYTRRRFLRAKPRHTPHHTHNTTQHTTQHTTPHGDRDRETQRDTDRETERDRERQRETEKERQDKKRKEKTEKTRQDKRRSKEKKREDETRQEKTRQDKRRSKEEKREDKKREWARQEKRQDEKEERWKRKEETGWKRRERMKGEMKRDRGDFFFQKNVSESSNQWDELAQNVSKKNPRRTNYSSIFSAKVQNLAVFFIYLHDSNSIFRAGWIKSEYIRNRTVDTELIPSRRKWLQISRLQFWTFYEICRKFVCIFWCQTVIERTTSPLLDRPCPGPPLRPTANNFALFFFSRRKCRSFSSLRVSFSWSCCRGSRPWPTQSARFGFSGVMFLFLSIFLFVSFFFIFWFFEFSLFLSIVLSNFCFRKLFHYFLFLFIFLFFFKLGGGGVQTQTPN